MVKEAHAYFTIYFVKKYVLFCFKKQCTQKLFILLQQEDSHL